MPKQQSLVKRAKSITTRLRDPKVSAEKVELAMAWLRDEITLGQARQAVELSADGASMIYCLLARAIRQAYREGRLHA